MLPTKYNNEFFHKSCCHSCIETYTLLEVTGSTFLLHFIEITLKLYFSTKILKNNILGPCLTNINNSNNSGKKVT